MSKKSCAKIVVCALICLVLSLYTGQKVFSSELIGWGYNDDGQIDIDPSSSPYCIGITAGRAHSLAMFRNGSLYAFGDNSSGQLNIPPEDNYISISSCRDRCVALRADGSVVGWGENTNGEFDGPVGNDFVAVAAGSRHSLALRSDGTIVGWGSNDFGQINVPGAADFVAIAAGRDHSLALSSDGSIVGWGNNDFGQIEVPSGNDFLAIAAGGAHSLALHRDGSIVGWGSNDFGQIEVPGEACDYVAIAAGRAHSLALRMDGSIVAWGDSSAGQIDAPIDAGHVAIAAGGDHSLAIKGTKALFFVEGNEGGGPFDGLAPWEVEYKYRLEQAAFFVEVISIYDINVNDDSIFIDCRLVYWTDDTGHELEYDHPEKLNTTLDFVIRNLVENQIPFMTPNHRFVSRWGLGMPVSNEYFPGWLSNSTVKIEELHPRLFDGFDPPLIAEQTLDIYREDKSCRFIGALDSTTLSFEAQNLASVYNSNDQTWASAIVEFPAWASQPHESYGLPCPSAPFIHLGMGCETPDKNPYTHEDFSNSGFGEPSDHENFWRIFTNAAYYLVEHEHEPCEPDTDSDGWCDMNDNCPDVYNPGQMDLDVDGLGDLCDLCPLDAHNDRDGDGVCGNVDNCPLIANADQTNRDHDDLGDACDACPLDSANDADGDGDCGDVDNCPNVANADQNDSDSDGLGDLCDLCPLDPDNDMDSDGVCGDVDNCPNVANADQNDSDSDGLGDLCDLCPLDPDNDMDGDGDCGNVDNCPNVANTDQNDSDLDGLGDACDLCFNGGVDDPDNDGICGDVDNCPDLANADQTDSDLDGLGDVCDACPLDAENDIDADGICGNMDNCPYVANADQTDTDGDNFGDACDSCPERSGIVIDSITPNMGGINPTTSVEIKGCSFQAGSTVGLYGGGLHLEASYDVENYYHTQDVYVHNNLAYIIYETSNISYENSATDMHGAIEIIDISDPAHPQHLGSFLTPPHPQEIYIADNYAYIANSEAGLQIWDISNPANAILIRSVDTPGSAENLFITGNLAYIADRPSLQIVDISDPAEASIIASYQSDYSRIIDVHIEGNYAYCANLNAYGLEVVDVSDPLNPSFVKAFFLDRGRSVYVHNNYIYLGYNFGVAIMDVDKVLEIDTYDLAGIAYYKTGTAYDIHIPEDSHYAYIAIGSGGFEMIDISDPLKPLFVNSWLYAGNPHEGLHVQDNYVYLTNIYTGLHIIDVGTLVNPSIVGSYITTARATHIQDSYAYINTGSSGLEVIDITDPAEPAYITRFYTNGTTSHIYETYNINDLYIHGNYAYLAYHAHISGNPSTNKSGFQIVDISDPTHPGLYSYLEFDFYFDEDNAAQDPDYVFGVPTNIEIASGYAYICMEPYYKDSGNSNRYLVVIDVSDPAHPEILASWSKAFELLATPYDIDIVGDYAYLGTRYGLQTLDISNPEAISLVGECESYTINNITKKFDVHNLMVKGNYAYAICGWEGFMIIDITDPTNPQVVGSCVEIEQCDVAVYVTDKYAYVGNTYYETQGVQVIDISNPSKPVMVAVCNTPGVVADITMSGEHLYVAAQRGGLQILEPFSPLVSELVSDTTISAIIPAGLRPGSYNLYVSNPNHLPRVTDSGQSHWRYFSTIAYQSNAYTVGAGSPELDVMMDLPKGWSMISLPVTPAVSSVKTVFPDAVVVYKYQKGEGYVRVKDGENLEVGVGYWILLNSPQSYVIRGTEIVEYTIPAADGWYMIGGCSFEARKVVTKGKIDVVYEYTSDAGYTRLPASEPLEPGKGYWILFSNTSEGAEFTAMR